MNVFDNLPLSQAIPNTFTSKVPKKLQYHSFTLVDSNQMITNNFKQLFTKIDKAMKPMKTDGKQVLVLVDNLNILMNGCYSSSELDFIEIVNEFVSFTNKIKLFSFLMSILVEKDSKTSIALGINRDLFDEENTMDIQFYRDLKNSVFDQIYELNRNLSGYSRDVHGQLNIITNKHATSDQHIKNVKFRLTENKVEVCLANQIHDGNHQILSEPLNHLIDDGGLSIVDAKLTFNSPLADLRNESSVFNQQIKQLNYELEYKLEVITEKQVQDSMREIEERTENEVREKLMKQQARDNEAKFEESLNKKRNLSKNRKLQDLVFILQEYLKERSRVKHSRSPSQKQLKQQMHNDSQNSLSQVQQNRRQIISKWDQQAKRTSPRILKKSISFVNTINDANKFQQQIKNQTQ